MNAIKTCAASAVLIVFGMTIVAAEPAASNTSQPPPFADGPAVGLLTVGPVSEEITAGVESWIWTYLAPIRRLSCSNETPTNRFSADSVAAWAERTVGANHPALLVLVGDTPGRRMDRPSYVTNSVAVVYPVALKTRGTGPADGAPKQWLPRVQREALRATAVALGVPPCPFPVCALSDCDSDSDLDRRSANPCPPCQGRVDAILRKRGASLEWRASVSPFKAGE